MKKSTDAHPGVLLRVLTECGKGTDHDRCEAMEDLEKILEASPDAAFRLRSIGTTLYGYGFEETISLATRSHGPEIDYVNELARRGYRLYSRIGPNGRHYFERED